MKDRVFLAYIAVCIFWGSTYLAIKIGVQEIPPMLFASIRFFVAGGIMLLYGSIRKLEFPKTKREVFGIGSVGLIMLTGGNGIIVYAEQWIDSGIASMMVATTPIFIALLEKLFIKNVKISTKGYIGLFVGFYGVYLLISPGASGSIIKFSDAIIILFATFLWSLGSVRSKMVKSNCSIVNNIGIQMVFGGFGLMIMSFVLKEYGNLTFSARGIMAMIYLIVFGSLVGYSCYIYILNKWPATKAGTYAYVNPVVAVILGNVILSEPISIRMVFSMATILFGVFIVQKSKIMI